LKRATLNQREGCLQLVTLLRHHCRRMPFRLARLPQRTRMRRASETGVVSLIATVGTDHPRHSRTHGFVRPSPRLGRLPTSGRVRPRPFSRRLPARCRASIRQEVLEDAGFHKRYVAQGLPRIFDLVVTRTELLPHDLEYERPIPASSLNNILNPEVYIRATISEVWILVAQGRPFIRARPSCSQSAFLVSSQNALGFGCRA
jgi:hypothetical protein